MKLYKLFLMLLPFIGIVLDFTFGYPGLTWVIMILPNFLPEALLVLLASCTIVTLELLFGASRNKNLRVLGLFTVAFLPSLTVCEGFSRIAESSLLGMPNTDVYRILILTGAQVILVSSVHILLLKEASLILRLWSGEEVNIQLPFEVDEIQHDDVNEEIAQQNDTDSEVLVEGDSNAENETTTVAEEVVVTKVTKETAYGEYIIIDK